MSEKRRCELERLLRKARQRVFEDERYNRIIDRCKARLKPVWDERHNRVMEDRIRVMFL